MDRLGQRSCRRKRPKGIAKKAARGSAGANPQNANEAALLILLGQKIYRSNEASTGSEVVDGLEQSGYTVDRVDRLFDDFITDGLVIKFGIRRSIRYRLTNQGIPRAEAIAQQVQSMVA